MKLFSRKYPNLPRFLSQQQYAQLVGLSTKAIHNRVYKGTQLGVVRESNRVLIDIDVALEDGGRNHES